MRKTEAVSLTVGRFRCSLSCEAKVPHLSKQLELEVWPANFETAAVPIFDLVSSFNSCVKAEPFPSPLSSFWGKACSAWRDIKARDCLLRDFSSGAKVLTEGAFM